MLIGSIALVLASLTANPLPPASNFVVWGWWGPPPAEYDLQTYKAAGFNTVAIPEESRYTDAVKYANTLGMRVFLVPPNIANFSPEKSAAFASQHKNVQGWLLGDFVMGDTASLQPLIKRLRELDPVRWPLVSVNATAQSPDWVKTMSTLLQSGCPAIAYHQQTFMEDGSTDEAAFYERCESARRVSLKTGLPLIGMIQVSKLDAAYRATSESDIRMQAYSYLAAGARGLGYHSYWGFPTNKPAMRVVGSMIDLENLSKNYCYEIAQRLNEEVLTLAPYLLNLKSEELYFVGDIPIGQQALPQNTSGLRAVEMERGAVGTFSDAQGNHWALVVNRRHGKKRSAKTQKSTAHIVVDETVEAIWEIDRLTGFEKEIPLENRGFYITLPGGTGSLFKLKSAPPR